MLRRLMRFCISLRSSKLELLILKSRVLYFSRSPVRLRVLIYVQVLIFFLNKTFTFFRRTVVFEDRQIRSLEILIKGEIQISIQIQILQLLFFDQFSVSKSAYEFVSIVRYIECTGIYILRILFCSIAILPMRYIAQNLLSQQRRIICSVQLSESDCRAAFRFLLS